MANPRMWANLLQTCPLIAQDALLTLAAFVKDLQPVALRSFVEDVLEDEAIGPAFVRCRASRQHHHSEPGGLLAHSVEGLPAAAALGAVARLDDTSIRLTQVAYLFHDVGKIWTVGLGGTPLRGYQRHEALIPEVLHPHLRRLDQAWAFGAAPLRYIWDFLAQSASTRGYAKFVGAEIVAWTDQLSTAANRGRTIDSLLGSFHLPSALTSSHDAFEGLYSARQSRQTLAGPH